MAKLVDALVSEASGSNAVRVRVPSGALQIKTDCDFFWEVAVGFLFLLHNLSAFADFS